MSYLRFVEYDGNPAQLYIVIVKAVSKCGPIKSGEEWRGRGAIWRDEHADIIDSKRKESTEEDNNIGLKLTKGLCDDDRIWRGDISEGQWYVIQ